jgi:hypothetical protein
MPESNKACEECGGPLQVSAGPGRTWPGTGISLPDDFVFDECPACGPEWMSEDLIDRLGVILFGTSGATGSHRV